MSATLAEPDTESASVGDWIAVFAGALGALLADLYTVWGSSNPKMLVD